jgi:hypothetical protein
MNPQIVERFRAYCKKERRDYSVQMEIILEEWLAQHETGVEYRHGAHEVLRVAESSPTIKKKEIKK